MRIRDDAPLITHSARRRSAMVERQLRRRAITDPRVLEAMGALPRELFLPAALAARAYDDSALPIEAGQTISQPYIVALMAEEARLHAASRVLEIGTGSGYAAAVFSQLAASVHTIERHGELANSAAARLTALDIRTVFVRTGDGLAGWPEAAPFDAILAAASGTFVPAAWKAQLALGGHLIMPLGDRDGSQELIRLTRISEHRFERHRLGAVMFVPLIG